jgi:hypothetical protein
MLMINVKLTFQIAISRSKTRLPLHISICAPLVQRHELAIQDGWLFQFSQRIRDR